MIQFIGQVKPIILKLCQKYLNMLLKFKGKQMTEYITDDIEICSDNFDEKNSD